MTKKEIADLADMVQEGIDCINTASCWKEGPRQTDMYNRGMDHLKRARNELLQAKHCYKEA